MNFEKLIAALKCSSQAHTKCDENCPYRTLEKTRDDFPIPADVVINGVGYWLGCDCDRMATDAADVIAKLSAEREEWIKFAEAMEKRVDAAQRQRDEMEDLMMKYRRDYQAAMEKLELEAGNA